MNGRGTTLVETLVALLIVSIVAAALATSTGAALRREVDVGRQERAAELAVEGLERLLAVPAESLAPRHEVETIAVGGETFFREVTIADGPSPGLWHLALRVRSDRRGAPYAIDALRRAAWRVR